MITLKTYHLLLKLADPFINRYLAKRVSKGKEDKYRLNERLGKSDIDANPRPDGKLIWLHGASVGEVISLIPIIKHLQKHKANILLTSGTRSSAKIAADKLPNILHQYIPVDKQEYVADFINHWRPDYGIWCESDLWPNIITTAHKSGCKLLLVNARMSNKSAKKWRFASKLIKQLLGCFSKIITQSDADTTTFKKLGANNVHTGTNLKYLADKLSYNDDALKTLQQQIGTRPIWLAASTHKGEEQIALNIHKRLQAKSPNLLTIILPRHPNRLKEITNLMDIEHATRSKAEVITANTQIYIADTLGEAGLFYKLCSNVFLGGSLAKIGGHNPIEPAQFNCNIIYGPHMFNFKQISAEFLANNLATQIADEDELYNQLLNNFADSSKQKNTAKFITKKQADNSVFKIVDEFIST